MNITQHNRVSARKSLGRLVVGLSVAALVIVCFVAETALATSGSVFVWPQLPNRTTTYAKQSGLQISVDTTWVGNRGYRPVQVTLTAPKSVGADVQITVRFHAGLWQNGGRSISVEQDFELVQGASRVTATLLVPQNVHWDSYGWEVWVDGKKDEELSLAGMGLGQSNSGGNSLYTALIVPGEESGGNAAKQLQDFSQERIEALLATATQLPEKWIGYANLDMVVATPQDLEQWKTKSPEQFTEMLRWVRTGGNLWVFDVGTEYEKLAQVVSSLGVQLEQSEETEILSLEQRGWRPLPLSSSPRQGADALVLLDGREKVALVSQLQGVTREIFETLGLAADSRHWFVSRAYGMGAITVFPKAYNRPRSIENSVMEAVQRSLLVERINWVKRHGNFPGMENRDFNEWLIPGVGSAPVFEFQLLISLFVIGIGPLNYWLLKRRHQLPLMLVTVPLAALATTVILFAYGIFSDGFSVRVRARSVTLIDQAAGEATCWARTSYYAGLAPAKGLKMPDDVVVYPIHPSQSGTNGYGQQQFAREQREVEWGEQQNLTRGWLASRTPTQYLSIAARASSKRLRFEPHKDRLSVINELGVDLVWLAVQDHDGSFYVGEVIDTDSTQELEKSDLIPAMSQLRTMITDNVLELPAGFVLPRRRGRSWGETQLSELGSLANNLMEAQINSVVSPLAENWGNGTYIAITAAGPELSLGVEDAIETSSFHVVRGSWSHE